MSYPLIIVHIMCSLLIDNPENTITQSEREAKLRCLMFDTCISAALVLVSGNSIYKGNKKQKNEWRCELNNTKLLIKIKSNIFKSLLSSSSSSSLLSGIHKLTLRQLIWVQNLRHDNLLRLWWLLITTPSPWNSPTSSKHIRYRLLIEYWLTM